MCRNIRVLYNFEPPTTKEEMTAAALQYVRKVSGLQRPSAVDEEVFAHAVGEVTAATERLLEALQARAPVRTREGEKAKAQARWKLRESRIRGPAR